MLVFYDEKTGKEVSGWNEFLRRKAFFIHGTTSEPERWRNWSEAVKVLNKISLPLPEEAYDVDFNWKEEATQFNNLRDRWPVSDRLVKYVKEKALDGDSKYEEIVLIGHSHGGNVAIMAADKLARDQRISRIYVITVGTPVFNKKTFKTTSLIRGLKQAAETKVTFRSKDMGVSYQEESIYTYYNPENPANWENGHKISHLSIYNEYDRVDGIAQAGSPMLENSRMTLNSSEFAYNPGVNKGVKSRLADNERRRAKYANYCAVIIKILTRLKTIIHNAEVVTKITFSQNSKGEGQDNVFIKQFYEEVKVLGYRKLSVVLPEFSEINLNLYLSDQLPRFDQSEINSMSLTDIRLLFKSTVRYSGFCTVFETESRAPLLTEYPYPVGPEDFRSPNIKLIDNQIDKISREIAKIKEFNMRTDKDKMQNSKWPVKVLYYGSAGGVLHAPIKYLVEGVNDHGFDINSPEIIQEAINKGYIKPFERVLKTRKTEGTRKTEK